MTPTLIEKSVPMCSSPVSIRRLSVPRCWSLGVGEAGARVRQSGPAGVGCGPLRGRRSSSGPPSSRFQGLDLVGEPRLGDVQDLRAG